MDEILEVINVKFIDPIVLGETDVPSSSSFGACRWSSSYSLTRQFFVLWLFLYVSSLFVYLLSASSTFALFYLPSSRALVVKSSSSASSAASSSASSNRAVWAWSVSQLQNEIFVSTWSLLVMTGLTAPVELLSMCGYGHVYYNYDDKGILYLIASPLLFLAFTDTLIYWIHRLLHHPVLYPLHKLHHLYKETTPFSAFSFHPLDGYAQGLPYHLFVLVFPMYSYLYALTLAVVGLWTVNIHDRVSLRFWGVNGAAHHTIHHTKFNYNYGQYFTFWDQVFGTYKDPFVTEPYTKTGLLGARLEGNDNDSKKD